MKAFLLILLLSQLVYGEDEFMTFSFINDSDEKRFYSLQKEVSCPLCEGSSIAGSNAPIAADIKNKIYTEILLGKSDEEILANLRDIFGEEVTYKPSFENNIFLWLFPLIFFLLIVFAARIFLKKMIKKYKVFGFSLALSAAIYFFLFGQENFQKLNFQKDLQLNFIDNASFEEKKNKIDSIINLSSNNPAQVYFLANYLFDKTEYALASRTLEHFILNFPNDTDAEVIALTAETKYLSNNQIFNDDIESLVQQSLNKDPANVRALILKGLKQTLDKNYDDALKSWSIAFEYSEDADQKRVIMAGMSSALKQLKSLED